MKSRKVVFLRAIFYLFACSSIIFAQEHDIGNLKLKINKINEILDKASQENDYETISAYYMDDVIILPNGEPLILGKEAFIENEKIAAEAGYKIKKIETSLINVFASGDLVHEVGKYKITLQVPGVPYDITDTGKYLVIWKIQSDDSLKIKLEMWNNDTLER